MASPDAAASALASSTRFTRFSISAALASWLESSFSSRGGAGPTGMPPAGSNTREAVPGLL